MRLREHVEAVELFEDFFRRFFRDAFLRRAGVELPAVPLDEGFIVAAAEGAPEAVGLTGDKTGDVDGQLVDLVLEEDDAQGTLQGALLQGMVVGDRFSLRTPSQVLLHAVVDADAGPDRPDFVGHVQEVARPEAGDGLHLGG